MSILAAALVFGGGALQAAANSHRPDGAHPMGRLEKIHDQLRLNAEQEALWKQAEEKTRETMKQMRDAREKMHQAMKQELEKGEPDFAAIARITDETRDSNLRARREARDLWLKLYAGLSPEQKIVARDFMRDRLAMADRLRAKCQSRRGAGMWR